MTQNHLPAVKEILKYRMTEPLYRTKQDIERLGSLSTKKQKEKLEELRRKHEDSDEEDLTYAEMCAQMKLNRCIADRALLLSIAPSLETTEKEKKKLERRKREQIREVKEEIQRPRKTLIKTTF